MKIRVDFVTNSSSSSYIVAITNKEFESTLDVINAIVKYQDLGPSWVNKLNGYIHEATVKDLDNVRIDYSHGESVRDLEKYEDDRANFLPDTKVFYSEIYAYGDEQPEVIDLLLSGSLYYIGTTILETEPI